ncbi:MAG: MaoC family dehydratase [Gammaproteobacteria bacterium]|nr:MaoC family dehydratase [Gammaproteobacteria bacterium]MCY4199102.1 MaoC family dehydratase [Gammaproteobacteria bacterium]
MNLTSNNTYFEDFEVGMRIKHARGTTIDEVENQMLTKLVMNTASGHWNEHVMKDTPFGSRLVFGFITASMVIGLATQDTAENAVKELGLDKIRFKKPVFHGDTVYAYTEVLSMESTPERDAGIIAFKHWGVNQKDDVVFEGERRVLLKKRPAER